MDGVLTDGSLNIGAEGELFKAFNARDGLGLSCLLRSGVRVAIITGRKSAIIHRRAEELGITELYEGIKDKRKILAYLAAAGGLGQDEIAYMGDDLNDLPALLYAGLACAPADAAPADARAFPKSIYTTPFRVAREGDGIPALSRDTLSCRAKERQEYAPRGSCALYARRRLRGRGGDLLRSDQERPSEKDAHRGRKHGEAEPRALRHSQEAAKRHLFPGDGLQV